MDFESINHREEKYLPLKFNIHYEGEEPEYDWEMLERFGVLHNSIFTQQTKNWDIGFDKIRIRDLVKFFIAQGWLSSEVLEKIYTSEGEISRDFLIGLAWLSYEAKELGLPDDEINELKLNIGTISIDTLRESIKAKHGS